MELQTDAVTLEKFAIDGNGLCINKIYKYLTFDGYGQWLQDDSDCKDSASIIKGKWFSCSPEYRLIPIAEAVC